MNAVWKHSRATGRARLVLLAIADHQGEIGAWPSIKTLSDMVNASERSVKRDIQELVELGELKVVDQAAPIKSQYKPNLYWVTISGVTDLISGVTDLTPGVTDRAIRGDTVGTQNLNITIKEPLKETINVQMDFEQEFSDFWDVYPRKQGKGEARKAFVKAVKKKPANEVIDAARRLAEDPNRPSNPKYTPMPSVWLNQERWDDDPYPGGYQPNPELIKRLEQGYF